MSAIAIIPARYGSSRFPGKPLANSTGKYLIQHVVERVSQAARVGEVLVATDDGRIAEAVAGFGGTAVLTSADHQTGTDRIAEVAGQRGLSDNALILNVQGDEPELNPGDLDLLIERMEREPTIPAGTLCCRFPAASDPQDPNCVKVVVNDRKRALYFSRSLIPYDRAQADGANRSLCRLHLGVYAYRCAFLRRFAAWSPTPLEQIERLEQLRILEHGAELAVEEVAQATAGIDTPQDYERFVERQRRSAMSRTG